VLIQGELLSANIMVCPAMESRRGLINWAKAEYLPPGTNRYGLKKLLGKLQQPDVDGIRNS